MEVDFVEAGVAMVVKPTDDLAIGAAAGEHGVKAKLDVGRQLGGFAARPSSIYDFGFTICDLVSR